MNNEEILSKGALNTKINCKCSFYEFCLITTTRKDSSIDKTES